jgi:hypothetical protein
MNFQSFNVGCKRQSGRCVYIYIWYIYSTTSIHNPPRNIQAGTNTRNTDVAFNVYRLNDVTSVSFPPTRSGENAALAAFKEFKRNNFEREDYQKGS